ncbi:NAD(P)/FAD-dependent oxidoreductase [Marinobacter sp. F4206]|uniref:NAD(P)/FAD-dependent oxidoreductase n=1 Tax=Marinobacter sp. F4206 TaxID=2861777 RepID=UPI001C5D7BF9|nr:NAD(P)/FAD-dependent oxidoreductase [Marinobacter sp. F4206]MBW4933891.1 NAD(P)/FAD-dependent oxidoreductase [Marinobacter sp. F4206]
MSQETLEAQTVVIGAGVVGLAIGRALARAGHEILILEAGDRFGEGLSSRNSEVIHAGIYYPEGSLKARLCVAGRQQLYQYCEARKVGYRKCGKWIVATSDHQAGSLEVIRNGAGRNAVELDLVSGASLSRMLPDITASAGLWSSETGIVDSHALMLSLLGDCEDAGGQLVLRAPVIGVETSGKCHRLRVGGDMPAVLEARKVINAAGLGAAGLAQEWHGLPASQKPRQWLARGVYFSYGGRHPFSNLIYPVPEPGGLGVHLTLDLAGQARFGPDVEWIDNEDYSVDPARVSRFINSIKDWWPGLDESRLQPAYAGIRPKLAGPDGGGSDFRIEGPQDHGIDGVVNLFGIESPGLTSCLAIADLVKAKLA